MIKRLGNDLKRDEIASDKRRHLAWLERDKYHGRALPRVRAKDLCRLSAGEPVDYLIGWRDFLGVKVNLKPGMLIPRAETEYWLAEAMTSWPEVYGSDSFSCLDLFCGSGCLGLAVMNRFPQAQVTFADCDELCLSCLKKSLRDNHLPVKRARLVKSDVWSQLSGHYDVVLANPPYVPSGRRLSSSVTAWESPQAVFAGPDGLSLLRKLFHQVKDFLTPRGRLYVEFDAKQSRQVRQLAKQAKFNRIELHRDQYGRWRYGLIAKN